jgi:hypothetical protein
MSIETALNTILATPLGALTPAVPLYWGVVPSVDSNNVPITEYVHLATVVNSTNPLDDFCSDSIQFTIVTRTSMVRAKLIDDVLKYELQRYKGISSSVKIQSITHTRSVDMPDADSGESIIASEFLVNYQGGF